MRSESWRVVVVRAWLHDGEVAVVLLVGNDAASATPVRRMTAGSVEAACAALASVLQELTADPTDANTVD